jgi:imidazolonepropionase-like amidohydrolase
MVLRVTGIVLPEREERTLLIDGGVLREEPVTGADSVGDGGWLLPGLVDMHTHPGAEKPGDPFEDTVLRRDLADQVAAGVLLVRAPGSAARIPAWAHDEDGLPRVRSAGPWLATPGRFFPNWARRITEAELAAAALDEATASAAIQQAASPAMAAGSGAAASASPSRWAPGTGAPGTGATGGWCKIIGDWAQDEPAVPLDVLRAAVSTVHEAGGKVAVHCQTAQGCANAVAAGADSLEHGMHLDPGLLDQMAAQGTALVPTIGAFAQAAVRVRAQPPGPRRDAFLRGWAALPTIARAAYEAGVTVLAGTDTHPCGTVAEEVERLISAGLPRAAALGAACWTARAWLGLPGLADGAPADLVVFAEDPVAHPDVLHHPSLIILRGQVLA